MSYEPFSSSYDAIPPPVMPDAFLSREQGVNECYQPLYPATTTPGAKINNYNYGSASYSASRHEPGLPKIILETLLDQGFTRGLAQVLHRNTLAFALRIWIVDNSGSMRERDGKRLKTVKPSLFFNNSNSNRSLQLLPCTRWEELQDTVEYHAQMAALLKAPTIFRLLNDPGRLVGPQFLSIAEPGRDVDADLAVTLSAVQNCSPGGVTPLIGHLREIRRHVQTLEPSLKLNGTKVVIVLATDGIPTDERGYSDPYLHQTFVQALRDLLELPVWIVVRLCTNDDSIVAFWNRLDRDLELSNEVLDDFESEAREVVGYNAWLNYGLPLHRIREMGCHNRVLDLLDERKLSLDEMKECMCLLFGFDLINSLPDPHVEWNEFCVAIAKVVDAEQKQWNPLTRRMEPWINVRRLKREYGRSFWWLKNMLQLSSVITILAIVFHYFE